MEVKEAQEAATMDVRRIFQVSANGDFVSYSMSLSRSQSCSMSAFTKSKTFDGATTVWNIACMMHVHMEGFIGKTAGLNAVLRRAENFYSLLNSNSSFSIRFMTNKQVRHPYNASQTQPHGRQLHRNCAI